MTACWEISHSAHHRERMWLSTRCPSGSSPCQRGLGLGRKLDVIQSTVSSKHEDGPMQQKLPRRQVERGLRSPPDFLSS